MTEPAPLVRSNNRFPGRGRLRARILAVAILPLLFATSLLAGYLALRDMRRADAELDRLGQELSKHLSDTAGLDMLLDNVVYLKRILDYEGQRHGTDSLGIQDAQGHWWLVSGQPLLLPRVRPEVVPRAWREGRLRYFSHPIDTRMAMDAVDQARRDQPGSLGQIVVVLNDDAVVAARWDVMRLTGALLAGLLVLASLLAWWLWRDLAKPLDTALAAVRKLAGGHLETRVPEVSPGEVGELERGINQLAQTLESHTLHMAHKVEAATAQLQEQKNAAEAAVLAKSKFLATASHDLRQPLHAMSLLVTAMKEKIEPGNAEARQLAGLIESSTHSMEHLLATLLDVSRLDAGLVVARPVCLPVAPILDRLRQQFEPQAAKKGLQLHIRPTRLCLFTDPTLLERILVNMLSNAIRYTDQGKVLLGLRRVQKDWVRIEVWDTGRGIPAPYRERIFEEYFQLENPERDRDKGLGLGLSIVKRLAQLLGSPIQVQSGPGGTCFSLRAARCQPSPTTRTSVAAETPSAAPIRHGLVAFIEDDETILEAMVFLFDQWGLELAAGNDVAEVKADLLELGRVPDAILSDYRLRSGRNGVEAINELRAIFGPGIPAGLITGDTAATTIQAINASGLPMLHKPVKPARLRAFLTHLLNPAEKGAPRPGD